MQVNHILSTLASCLGKCLCLGIGMILLRQAHSKCRPTAGDVRQIHTGTQGWILHLVHFSTYWLWAPLWMQDAARTGTWYCKGTLLYTLRQTAFLSLQRSKREDVRNDDKNSVFQWGDSPHAPHSVLHIHRLFPVTKISVLLSVRQCNKTEFSRKRQQAKCSGSTLIKTFKK